MNPHFKLFRIGNCSIVAAGVWLGYFCLPVKFAYTDFLVGLISMVCLTIAGNIHNDIRDLQIDKTAHPDRPLVTGEISVTSAWIMTLVFFGTGNLLPWLKNSSLVWLTLGITILLLLYNIRFKKTAVVGNVIIAVLCSLPIYYAEYPSAPLYTLLPCLFAFWMTLAREVIKDIEDKDADEAAGLKTFPIVRGLPAAKKLSLVCVLFTIVLLPLPFVFALYHFSYLIILLVFTGLPFFNILKQLKSTDTDFHLVQNLLKKIMLWGIIALAAGQF